MFFRRSHSLWGDVHKGTESLCRAYSSFLRGLPKVGGGVSRFAPPPPKVSSPQNTNKLKLETTRAPQDKANIAKTAILGKNRFEQQFSKPKVQTLNGGQSKTSHNNGQLLNGGQSKTSHHNGHKSNMSPEARKAKKYEEMKQQISQETKAGHSSHRQHSKRPAKKVRVDPIKVRLPPFISVANFATILNVPLNRVIKKLKELGYEDARHNFILDKENASLIADEYNFEVVISENEKDELFPDTVKKELLKERPPVVTIMGHVDHGKTTILDHLRKSAIVDQEFGGITQHIGAFSVITPLSKKKITFLDTPGHAAFLKMRERGAIITDIVILVVAADDSVMPQTIEAIKHAKRSGVPLIVAINKCDIQGVNCDKVLADLSAQDIDIEDYGGDTQTVRVSGKTGLNMDKLEEAVITLSEMSDFQAEEKGIRAEGWIIESQVVQGLGSIATVLVRRGTLKTGDVIVAGTTYCKIRGMKDEKGVSVKSAGPSTPVRIWGWKNLPNSGDQVIQAKSELVAKTVICSREARSKQDQATLDIDSINKKRLQEINELKRLEKINELKAAGLDSSVLETPDDQTPECTVVKYIIKSDVYGSAEAIKGSIDGLGNEEVKSLVIQHEAGEPSELDLDLAKTLNANILCFNCKVPKTIASKADKMGVSISEHNVIYRLIEQVTEELTSHLLPRIETKFLSEVEIKDAFTVTVKKSKVKIAGCKVATGALNKSAKVKVFRGDDQVYDGHLSSLKYVKEDINEARKGSECGIGFTNWDKFEAGDVIKSYEEISHPRFL